MYTYYMQSGHWGKGEGGVWELNKKVTIHSAVETCWKAWSGIFCLILFEEFNKHLFSVYLLPIVWLNVHWDSEE